MFLEKKRKKSEFVCFFFHVNPVVWCLKGTTQKMKTSTKVEQDSLLKFMLLHENLISIIFLFLLQFRDKLCVMG